MLLAEVQACPSMSQSITTQRLSKAAFTRLCLLWLLLRPQPTAGRYRKGEALPSVTHLGGQNDDCNFPVCYREGYRHCDHTLPFSPGAKQQLRTSRSRSDFRIREGRARGATHTTDSLSPLHKCLLGWGIMCQLPPQAQGKERLNPNPILPSLLDVSSCTGIEA